MVPLGHRPFEPLELLFGFDHVGPATEDVVLKRKILVAGRTLVMQGDPGALLEAERTGVVLRLTGQDPQQG